MRDFLVLKFQVFGPLTFETWMVYGALGLLLVPYATNVTKLLAPQLIRGRVQSPPLAKVWRGWLSGASSARCLSAAFSIGSSVSSDGTNFLSRMLVAASTTVRPAACPMAPQRTQRDIRIVCRQSGTAGYARAIRQHSE
jgi:hypothetical protein